MKKTRQSVFLSILCIVAYLLNACSGLPAGAQQLSDDQNGPVTSVGAQPSGLDDVNDNSTVDNANETNTNDDNVNDNTVNSNDDQDENSNSTDEVDNGNDNDDDQGEDVNDDQEVTGTVEAITADSITIDGVTYSITDLTEFNDVISVGDEVKIQVIVNTDGTFTISEIEITDETSVDDGNSNANVNGDDDNQGNNDDQGEDDQGDDGGGDDSGGGGGDD